MAEFDLVLDECITLVVGGRASVEDCLARHPAQAEQLKPLLERAAGFAAGRRVEPGSGYRARARADLYAYMRSHPRRPGPAAAAPFWKVAVSLAALALFLLATTTAFAQNAMPGGELYGLKTASEAVWRALAPDPVSVDLAVADRRAREIVQVAAVPSLEARTLDQYELVVKRLISEMNPENTDLILPALQAERAALAAHGIAVPALDHFLAPNSPDQLLPTSLPGALPVLPKVLPTLRLPTVTP
jgi:hypothetical protein